MGTHYHGTSDEIRALNTLIKLFRANNVVVARTQVLFSQYKLTESQFGVLEALYHLGPTSQAKIGKKIMKTGGNMTMVIDNLEKRGFVERERNPDDRRYITVHLTVEGNDLIEDIFPSHVKGITKVFSVLSKEEQVELGRLCKKLGLSQF